MANWDDLKAVLHLVRGGSLAAAAQSLNVNYTTVSRRVARAEAALDQILFDRLVDGYRPTQAGLSVARHAIEMETREDEIMRTLTGQDERLSGRLVVTVPHLLVGPHLAKVITPFCAAHPDVELHLQASNDLVDLTRRGADLAIRISRSPGDSLKGVRLTEQHTASFATQGWADQIARDPRGRIDWVIYDGLGNVLPTVSNIYPNNHVIMQCNDMVAMLGAAQAGVGVVRMPMFLGRATSGLVQVPVLAPQPYADIWMVAHPDVWPSARVAAFRAYLQPYFKQNRSAFVA